MSKTYESELEPMEIAAIIMALTNQISDCEAILEDPEVSSDNAAEVRKTLSLSKSALSKIEASVPQN